MSVLGRWRIVETPDYDMVEPAPTSCSTKTAASSPSIASPAHSWRRDGDAVEFSWNGNDEMDEASGDGWAELQPDGSLQGEICFHNGDDSPLHRPPPDFFNSLLTRAAAIVSYSAQQRASLHAHLGLWNRRCRRLSSACFVGLNRQVIGVDVTPAKVDLLKRGLSPIVEPSVALLHQIVDNDQRQAVG